MAKTVRQLEEELAKVSEDTRRAYDALHGTDFSSLYRQYEIAKNTLKKKGLFESARLEAENAIKNLEPRIKAAEIEYKKYQDQKNALTDQIKTVKAEEQKKKTTAAETKSAANVYASAIDELGQAELGLGGYQTNDKYISAYKKAKGAYDTLVKSGITPSVALPEPKITIPQEKTGTGVGADGKPIKEPTITEFIATITSPKNKQLLIDVQKDLAKNFGYKGPVNGSPSKDFLPALQSAYTQRVGLPEAWRGTDFRSFLSNPGLTTTGTGTGAAAPLGTTTVSSPTEAAAYINQVFKSELNRDATADEIKKLTKSLNKAQQDPKNANRIVKGAGGVNQYTGGLNVAQFVTDAVRALPEFATKKSDTRSINSQDLLATVRANGLPIDQSQLDTWAKEIENGSIKQTTYNQF